MRKTVLSVILALLLVLSLATPIMAASYKVNDTFGTGKVSTVTNKNITSDGDLTYSDVTYTDAKGYKQIVKVLELNSTENYIPVVYSQYSGYGSRVLNSAKDAESKYGYNVVAGVNASFFSMAALSTPAGSGNTTYGGVNIQDGKIIQGNNDFGSTNVCVFYADGTADIVSTKVSYKLYCNGSEWFYSGSTSALLAINNCPLDANRTYSRIYYYDTSCGNNTDTCAAGTEIVCTKNANSELTVGGTLYGTVKEIRKVDSGAPVGKDEFVLYVKDGSSLGDKVSGVKVGDTFSIAANETIAASVEKMNSAMSAFVCYTYIIVRDGVSTVATDGLGEDFNTTRAQRTALGIKADGSYIILTCTGRDTENNNPGLTVYDLADLMIQQGCVYAINLDGGGSTTMVIDEGGTLVEAQASTRPVANSLLIIERPAIDADLEQTLNDLITANESNPEPDMQAAVTAAKAVIADSNSTNGMYTKAIMQFTAAASGMLALDNALAKADTITRSDFSEEQLEAVWAAYAYALAVKAEPDATGAAIKKAAEDLLATLEPQKNMALNKPYTIKGVYPSNSAAATYPDEGGSSLTDGNYASTASYSDTAFVGLNIGAGDMLSGEPSNVIVDFGASQSFSTLAVEVLDLMGEAGIKAPSAVNFFVSDDGSNWTALGEGTFSGTGEVAVVKNTLKLTTPATGRYVKYEFTHASNWMFVSEVEAYGAVEPIEDFGYINDFNRSITSGAASIFTSDAYTDLKDANVLWTTTLFCEYDEAKQGWKVVKTKGADGKSATLGANQIAIAVHDAQSADKPESAVNRTYTGTASIGDYIEFHGIFINDKTIYPEGFFRIASASEFDADYNGMKAIETPDVPVNTPAALEGYVNLVPELELELLEAGGGTATYEYTADGKLIIRSTGGWPCESGTYVDALTVPVESSKITIDFTVETGYTALLLYSQNQTFKLHQNVNAADAAFDAGSGDLGPGTYSITLDLKDLAASDGTLTGKTPLVADDYGLVTFTSFTFYATSGATVTINDISVNAPAKGLTAKTGSGVTVKDNKVTGVKAGLTVDEIKALFTNTGLTVSGTGTGATITYNGKTYTMIVKGDVDGNGEIAARDYLLVRQYLLGNTLTANQLEAASFPGTTPSALTYRALRMHILGTSNIYD